jgi:hypothetical protein
MNRTDLDRGDPARQEAMKEDAWCAGGVPGSSSLDHP